MNKILKKILGLTVVFIGGITFLPAHAQSLEQPHVALEQEGYVQEEIDVIISIYRVQFANQQEAYCEYNNVGEITDFGLLAVRGTFSLVKDVVGLDAAIEYSLRAHDLGQSPWGVESMDEVKNSIALLRSSESDISNSELCASDIYRQYKGAAKSLNYNLGQLEILLNMQ